MEEILTETLIEKLKEGKKQCVKWFIEEVKCRKLPVASERAYGATIDRINKKYKNLKKNVHQKQTQSQLNSFLKQKVKFPMPDTGRSKTKEDLFPTTSNIVKLKEDNDVLKQTANKLASELKENIEKNSELKNELKEVHNTKKYKIRKRLETMNLHVKHLRTRNKEQEKYISVLQVRISKKNTELKSVRNKLCYSEKCKIKFGNTNESLRQDIRKLRNEIQDLHQECESRQQDLDSSNQENDWLREMVESNEKEEVQCFDHDKRVYLPSIQACVYKLLENHVSARQVSNVIETVLSVIGKKADRLPSASTVHNMNLQRLSISQQQLADISEDKAETSLYTDETSKFGKKVCGYHIRDKEGNFFTLGMRDMITKSGKDTLECLKEILLDIDMASQDPTKHTSNEILKNIRSTMSDSASTEIKFNELLEEYRKSILPYAIYNFHQLNNYQKESVSKLLNFFCGLHSIVHIAETCNKSLLEVEKDIFIDSSVPIHDPAFKKNNESGTARLVRTSCKAFARGADEKSGCHIQFITYIHDCLKANNYRSLKLVPYRGNRFNILFHNAGQVYLLHQEMINFLDNYELNRLTRSVLHDLKQPVFIAGCKALGLISKFISTPLWNLLENKEVKILDMNKHYLNLQLTLREACENIGEFMAGNIAPFSGEVKHDAVYIALTADSSYDVHCQTILSILLPSICQYISRKFKDYLPEGKYSQVSEEEIQVTESVEKHNKHCERVFAYYDQLLRFKPHISTLASEAYIMFSLNKTSAWLNNKSTEEIRKITEQSRRDVKRIRKKFKERQDVIREQRNARLEKLRQEKEAAEARKLKQQELNTQDIIYHGLWQTHEIVDKSLETYQTKSSKIAALKAQLRFRKEILNQKTKEPSVYNFTKLVNGKRISLSIEELTINVKKLLSHAFTIDEQQVKDKQVSLLVQKRVKHKFLEDDKEIWYTGKVISQVGSMWD